MKKKIAVVIVMALSAGMLFARPHGGHRGPKRDFRGAKMHHRSHHRPHHPHHHSGWGRGGRNFWPGFAGAFVGGVVANTIVRPTVVTTPVVTTPVVTTPIVTTPVVTQPVYTTQQVWVPGAYVDQVQPNGTVIRVWQPGHYETRSVLVQ